MLDLFQNSFLNKFSIHIFTLYKGIFVNTYPKYPLRRIVNFAILLTVIGCLACLFRSLAKIKSSRVRPEAVLFIYPVFN